MSGKLTNKIAVILVGSSAYLKGFPQYVNYGAAKAASHYYTKA